MFELAVHSVHLELEVVMDGPKDEKIHMRLWRGFLLAVLFKQIDGSFFVVHFQGIREGFLQLCRSYKREGKKREFCHVLFIKYIFLKMQVLTVAAAQ